MDLFNLSAILTLDTSQYENGINKAENRGKMLATGAKVGAVALGAATAAAGAFAAASVKTGMSFDSAMSQVGATMLKTSEELQEEVGAVDTAYGHFEGNLREFAQFLGSNTAFSATQAAEALNYMALAGYDTQQSMDMLPNVLSLAAAGNMELARASDMVTDAQTAFGIDAERTAQMVDEMAKAASTGNTSVSQLGDAFLVVGGLAKELNGGMVTLADGTQAPVDGLQEMEIALTAMANAGIKGSEAGTHMRNMLLKLSSPTSDGTKQLEALGVSVFDTEGKMRSLSDIFGDLNGALGDLTQQEKIQAISDLFNARDMASAEAMLAAIDSDWDKIGESILNADGAAADMAEIQLDNLAGDITLFKSALEGAQIALSDQLAPSLRQFVQFGTEAISTLSTAFSEGGLTGAMDALGEILGEGLAMIIAGVPQFVEAGAALLVALGRGIYENLPLLGDAGMQMLTYVWELISQNGVQMLEAGMSMVESLAMGVLDNIPALITQGGAMLEQFLAKLFEYLPQLMDRGGEFITNMATGVTRKIPAIISAIASVMSNLIARVMQNMPTMLQKGVEIIAKMASGVSQNIPAIVSAIAQALAKLLSTIGQNLPQFLQKGIELIGKILAGIIQAVPQIISAIPGILSNIASTFSNYDWASIGSAIISGIANGIRNAADRVISAIGGVATSALNKAKSILHIGSPSKVFRDQVGKMISAGMALGIEDGESDVLDAIGSLYDDLDDIGDMDYETALSLSKTNDDSGQSAVDELIRLLGDVIERMDEMNGELDARLVDAFSQMRLSVNGREFGRLVRDVRTA